MIGFWLRLVVRLVDRIAAQTCIWALNRLYGGGCVVEREPECIGCAVGAVLTDIENGGKSWKK